MHEIFATGRLEKKTAKFYFTAYIIFVINIFEIIKTALTQCVLQDKLHVAMGL